jgi:hypothetical protein
MSAGKEILRPRIRSLVAALAFRLVPPPQNIGPGVLIGGTLSPNVAGFLGQFGTGIGGRPVYASGPGSVPASSAWREVRFTGSRWFLNSYPTGATGPRESWRSAVTTAATPNLATGWEPDPDSDGETTGTPTFSIVA